MSQELVMIKWNKKCIKVLPLIVGLKKVLIEYYKNDKNKKQKSNCLYLTYWNKLYS
jgi:hypothetical protein